MIRKTDKYLLLFLMMIGFCLRLNAERLKPDCQLLTVNCSTDQSVSQRSTLSRTLCLPIFKTRYTSFRSNYYSSHPGTALYCRKYLYQGNRVTKSFIITRELPFKTGDSLTLQQLTRYFAQSREHLINTRLFNEVTVSLKEFRGYTVDINIDVKERWYIFPLPYVRPVDRNFTAWASRVTVSAGLIMA